MFPMAKIKELFNQLCMWNPSNILGIVTPQVPKKKDRRKGKGVNSLGTYDMIIIIYCCSYCGKCNIAVHACTAFYKSSLYV